MPEENDIKVDPHKEYNLSGLSLLSAGSKMIISEDNKFTLTGNQVMELAKQQAEMIDALNESQIALFSRMKLLTRGATVEAALFSELQDLVKEEESDENQDS